MTMQPFRVVFVIFHIGDRVTCGHYQAGLCNTESSARVPQANSAVATWAFHICNDRCRSKPARAADLRCSASYWLMHLCCAHVEHPCP